MYFNSNTTNIFLPFPSKCQLSYSSQKDFLFEKNFCFAEIMVEIAPKLCKCMCNFNKSEQSIFPEFLPWQTDSVFFKTEFSSTGSSQYRMVSAMTCTVASSSSEHTCWTELLVCCRDTCTSSSKLSHGPASSLN